MEQKEPEVPAPRPLGNDQLKHLRKRLGKKNAKKRDSVCSP